MSEQTQFPYRSGVISGIVTPKDDVQNDKAPLRKDNVVDPGKKLHFAVKENVWGGIVKITFLNIRN